MSLTINVFKFMFKRTAYSIHRATNISDSRLKKIKMSSNR